MFVIMVTVRTTWFRLGNDYGHGYKELTLPVGGKQETHGSVRGKGVVLLTDLSTQTSSQTLELHYFLSHPPTTDHSY